MVVFIKQQVRQLQKSSITQYFHIFDAKSNDLLYILKDDEVGLND